MSGYKALAHLQKIQIPLGMERLLIHNRARTRNRRKAHIGAANICYEVPHGDLS